MRDAYLTNRTTDRMRNGRIRDKRVVDDSARREENGADHLQVLLGTFIGEDVDEIYPGSRVSRGNRVHAGLHGFLGHSVGQGHPHQGVLVDHDTLARLGLAVEQLAAAGHQQVSLSRLGQQARRESQQK